MTKPGDVDHYTRVRCYGPWWTTITSPDASCSACCRWRCAWPARAKSSGTPSSAATTAAPTSSSAATTPAPATTRPASRSTAVRRPGVDGQACGRDRHGDGRLQAMVFLPDENRYSPVDEVPMASRRPTSRERRSETITWPRGCSSPSGSAGRPWPRSSARRTRPSSARA